MPTIKVEVENVATPPLSGPVPIVLPPSRNVTIPVGVPVPGALAESVAVNVIDCPNVDGFADDVMAAVVSALFTTCGLPVSAPLLLLKLASPP